MLTAFIIICTIIVSGCFRLYFGWRYDVSEDIRRLEQASRRNRQANLK